MIDSKFFGSPTKIFEYMALAGGIVASDLEQIGQVLSPALTPDEAARGRRPCRDERAVLCAPGDVDEFVRGVVALARQPELARALGQHAQDAARDHYSWTRHVANLWRFLTGDSTASESRPICAGKSKGAEGPAVGARELVAAGRSSGTRFPPQHIVATGDAYKDQVQRQWNNDPAGSHYVSEAAASHAGNGFSRPSAIATAGTRRGCPRRWSSPATGARRCSRSAAEWAPTSRSSPCNGAR